MAGDRPSPSTTSESPSDERERLQALMMEPYFQIALLAREAWREPYETYWWKPLGEALNTVGLRD